MKILNILKRLRNRKEIKQVKLDIIKLRDEWKREKSKAVLRPNLFLVLNLKRIANSYRLLEKKLYKLTGESPHE